MKRKTQLGRINQIDDARSMRAVGNLIQVILATTHTSKHGAGGRVRLAPSPLVAPLPRRSERKPSGIPSVTVVPTVMLQSVPAFLLRTPGGDPATTANVAERTRSPERVNNLSAGGFLTPPLKCAKPKGIPVDRRDFSLGKRYSAAASFGLSLYFQHHLCCSERRVAALAQR